MSHLRFCHASLTHNSGARQSCTGYNSAGFRKRVARLCDVPWRNVQQTLSHLEWRPARWSVCLPLLIFPCTIKSRSSLLAPAHPDGSGKRAVKRLWCCSSLLLVLVHVLEIERSPLPNHAFGIVFSHVSIDLIVLGHLLPETCSRHQRYCF